ncbi:hypothetical protein [uncultured Chryseobacterium sp.]|uniref:RNA polymerase factor sigma-54 n=1 Tax=uncultured Chryseobacterium sp. TaxID=259322 RepID=UPI00374803C1
MKDIKYYKLEEIMISDKYIEKTINEILKWQKKYLQTNNKKDLRQMTLQNISDLTDIDKSVISRICKSVKIELLDKFIDLKSLFHSGGIDGNSAFEISSIMLDLIVNEDPKHRYTDTLLCEILNASGYPISRRTVCKYREAHLNYPKYNKRH